MIDTVCQLCKRNGYSSQENSNLDHLSRSLIIIKRTEIICVLLNISASTQVVNWYPKKSGPPATVTKNESHTGLHLLWQKHLQQVSKRVGIEQAKVIASDPDFQSPHRLFETYRQAFSTLNQF